MRKVGDVCRHWEFSLRKDCPLVILEEDLGFETFSSHYKRWRVRDFMTGKIRNQPIEANHLDPMNAMEVIAWATDQE